MILNQAVAAVQRGFAPARQLRLGSRLHCLRALIQFGLEGQRVNGEKRDRLA